MLTRFFLPLFIITSTLTSMAHNKVGNGGGGRVSEAGEYQLLTAIPFEKKYSGLTTEIENCSSQIFDDVKNDIRKMQSFIPQDVSAFLINNVCRNLYNSRANYRWNPQTSSILKMKLDHFKNIYSQATGLKKNEIVIYAVTVQSNTKTYFMPEFYKLTYFKQKIILFHELFWSYYFTDNLNELSPKQEVILYQKMLALEQALIAYLTENNNTRNKYHFSRALLDFKEFKN